MLRNTLVSGVTPLAGLSIMLASMRIYSTVTVKLVNLVRLLGAAEKKGNMLEMGN